MAFEENRVLFGHDRTERIVAAEFQEPNGVALYIAQADGSNAVRQETFHPFLWCDAPPPEDAGASLRRLEGDLPFAFLLECESWRDFSRLRTLLKNGGKKVYALSDPAQQ